MGTCFDANAKFKQQHEAINIELENGRLRNRKRTVVVLTGMPNSGKTTILKHLSYLPKNKLEENNIGPLKSTKIIKDIRQNCNDNIIILCEINDDQKSIQLLQELTINNENNLPQIADIISNIWDKHQIKSTYKYRFSYGADGYIFHDNMEAFFDKIHEIMNVNYNPTEQDIVTSKTHYRKIVEMRYLHDDRQYFQRYNLVDVPYPIEREVIHQFDAVTAVIFVASLTDYCISIYDKGIEENQMHAALDYFDHSAVHEGVLANAFKNNQIKFCVMSFSSDWLYPTSESRMIVQALNAVAANVSFIEIETDKGHDAFLLDEPEMHRTLAGFINGCAGQIGLY